MIYLQEDWVGADQTTQQFWADWPLPTDPGDSPFLQYKLGTDD